MKFTRRTVPRLISAASVSAVFCCSRSNNTIDPASAQGSKDPFMEALFCDGGHKNDGTLKHYGKNHDAVNLIS